MPRHLGQHFLKDQSVVSAIAAALELNRTDRVVEIGAGRGVLTRALAAEAGHVLAIEIDGALTPGLNARFADANNVTILQANALDLDPCELSSGKPYKLAGNLPYYITGALLRRYMGSVCRPRLAVLMVQLEVAQRMLAKPGAMNLLALSTQLYSKPSMVTRVRPQSFRPAPKVHSAVVRLESLPEVSVSIPDEETFFRVARAGFSGKRKQVANSLSRGLNLSKDETISMLRRSGVEPSRRPEDLSLQQWATLATEAAGTAGLVSS